MTTITRTQAIVNRAIELSPKMGPSAALKWALDTISASEHSKRMACAIFGRLLVQADESLKTKSSKKRNRKSI